MNAIDKNSDWICHACDEQCAIKCIEYIRRVFKYCNIKAVKSKDDWLVIVKSSGLYDTEFRIAGSAAMAFCSGYWYREYFKPSIWKRIFG